MFKIVVYDNGRYMDESAAYTLDGFANYATALQKAQQIVQEDLNDLYRQGMHSEALFEAYKLYGSDPVIQPPLDRDEQFSAWQFAAEESAYVCASKQGAGSIPVQVVGAENRITRICFADFPYFGNETAFLDRILRILNNISRHVFADFEVPLDHVLETGQLPWYAFRSDIGGFRDYSLNHRLAYIKGNRFAGMHVDLCQSTGYDLSESRVELRAFDAAIKSRVYISAELDTGSGILCFTPGLPLRLQDWFRIDDTGNIFPTGALLIPPPVFHPAPNNSFSAEPGFVVVEFKNTLLGDLHTANLIRGIESKEQALKQARNCIEQSIDACFRPFFSSSSELFQRYMEQGSTPALFGPEGEIDFDAWAYARALCERRFGPEHPPV